MPLDSSQFAAIAKPLLEQGGTLAQIGEACGGLSKQRVLVRLNQDPELRALHLAARHRRVQEWNNPFWPRQQAFREDVATYREQHGVSHEDLAGLLGMTKDGLKQAISNQRRPTLHVSTLQRAAKLFGRSLLEYLEDPALEGLSQAQRSAAIAAMQSVAQVLLQRK